MLILYMVFWYGILTTKIAKPQQLQYCRGQQRGRLTAWHQTWKCESVEQNSLWKRSVAIDIHQHFLNVDAGTVKQWVVSFSSSDSNMKNKPCSGWPYTAVTWWNQESLSAQTGGFWQLFTALNIGFNALETVVAGLEYCKVCMKWIPQMLIQKKNTICNFVRTFWINMRWQFPILNYYQWWDMVSAPWTKVRMAVHGVVTWTSSMGI